MTGFFAAKNVVDVKDIVAVLVVVPIVFHSLAGFGQDSPRVPRGLVVEPGVANAIGGRKVSC